MSAALAAAAAAAAAVALILYLIFIRRPTPADEEAIGSGSNLGYRRVVGVAGDSYRGPERPPEGWCETLLLLLDTLRFAFAETIGKWGLCDLVFGIRYHMRRKGNLEVSSVFASGEFGELKGQDTLTEMKRIIRLLLLCFYFSKNDHQAFLQFSGFSEDDVIIKGNKGKFLKPAFTILRDRNSKSFILLIPGALSLTDKLTAATGPLVPFHHVVLSDGRVNNLILGYAHCGMVVAARWIGKCVIPCFLRELKKYPDYRIEIVGHSMGAGIATLLTYMLHEREELSSSTCVALGPAACMTWDLAESGKDFVTAIVNATDLVPTFSAVSVSNLHSEISSSLWLKNQIMDTGFINGICHITTTIKSHLQLISIGRSNLRGDSKCFQPLASSSKVPTDHVQNTLKAVNCCSVPSLSCMTKCWHARTSCDEDRGASTAVVDSKLDDTVQFHRKKVLDKFVNSFRVSETNGVHVDTALHINGFTKAAYMEESNVSAQLSEREKEKSMPDKDMQTINYGTFHESNIEFAIQNGVGEKQALFSGIEKAEQLYPPGRIMHMVAVPALEMGDENPAAEAVRNRSIGIYDIPRHMYGKIRLSQNMINDHYMPRYIKMMELLIHKLNEDETEYCNVV